MAGQGTRRVLCKPPPWRNGLPGSTNPTPGGESFLDLSPRLSAGIEQINAEQAGRDIIAVAHGGMIKAAIALALGGQPDKGRAKFEIDNCSVTWLDHLASANYAGWRVPNLVNHQPWLATGDHPAMHQPAGPEITKHA